MVQYVFTPFYTPSVPSQPDGKIGLPRANPRGKSPPANAGDMGSNPRSRRSAGEGNDNPLHSILAWGMLDRGTWWATVHGITKESDMT